MSDVKAIEYNGNENDNNYDLGYDGELVYFPSVRNASRTLRGCKKIHPGLSGIVGSKAHLDIVRQNHFMPGQFNEWNAKETGGNNKYWGGDQDIDGDEIDEFVVRRGGEHGPMIAVNGYTTKQSDWLPRKMFYEAYPNRKDRKGKSVKSYMRDEYFKPKYGENHMDVTSFDDRDNIQQYEDLYHLYVPKSKGPYKALGDDLVFPTIKTVIGEIARANNTTNKDIRNRLAVKLGNSMFETSILADVYYDNVKFPILKKLGDTVHAFKDDFEKLRKQTKGPQYSVNLEDNNSPEYKDFERWLFSKADIKKAVKTYVTPLLTTEFDRAKTNLTNQLMAKFTKLLSA